MNIEKAFRYPFEDKEWTGKLGLGALISFVPVVNFALSGYMVGILRNVMNGAAEALPTWDDFGKRFSDGLILFAAGFIYALPVLILLCLPLSALAFSGILSENRNMQDIAQAIGGAGTVLLFCFLCVFTIYGLALSIIRPVILVLFAREGTFASCFKLREAFELIRSNPAAFFTAWAVSLAAGFGVSAIGGFVNFVLNLIPCIGWVFGMALWFLMIIYLLAVDGHLFGQFGREALGQNQLATTS